MGQSKHIKRAHLGALAAVCVLSGVSGCAQKPVVKKVAPPAQKTSNESVPFQIRPLSNHIYGGLAGMTPGGNVLYFIPTAQQGRNFSWNNVGIWDPLTGAHSTLMPSISGHYAGSAVADQNWAVAIYLPFESSAQVPRNYSGQGWKLVALNRRSGQHWTIATDSTGALQGTALSVNVEPLISLWNDQVIWTQYSWTKGQYHQTLYLLNLVTRVRQTITDTPHAPLHQIDVPTIHGNYVAFCPSTIVMKPQLQASEDLSIMNLKNGRIVAKVQGGSEPVFGSHGDKVYFWYRNSKTASNGSIGVISVSGGTPAYYAKPTSPNDMFWGPNAGNKFVSWYSSGGAQWAKVISTGQWVQFPNPSLVNSVNTDGDVIAWSQRPQGSSVLPTIFAARYADK